MKEEKERINKISQKALKKAEELGQQSTAQDQAEIEKKLPLMKRGPIKKVWDKVLFLWNHFKSPQVPLRLKITIIGALLYLILPSDLLPDFVPGLGLVDDLSVILIVFREVSKYALPKIEKKIENKIYDSCYEKIDARLSYIFKSTLINTACTFLANVIACVILVTKPFGQTASRYTAISLFILIGCWTFYRIIRYLRLYGATTKKILSAVIKRKSISKGLADFVRGEYSYINRIYAGIDIAKNFIPDMPEIPDLAQIMKTFENHYKKKIILFLLLFLLYSLLIWLTKFLLLT